MLCFKVNKGSLASIGDPASPLALIRVEDQGGNRASLTVLSSEGRLAVAEGERGEKKPAQQSPNFLLGKDGQISFYLGENALGYVQVLRIWTSAVKLGFEFPRAISADRAKIAASKRSEAVEGEQLREAIGRLSFVRRFHRGRAQRQTP